MKAIIIGAGHMGRRHIDVIRSMNSNWLAFVTSAKKHPGSHSKTLNWKMKGFTLVFNV